MVRLWELQVKCCCYRNLFWLPGFNDFLYSPRKLLTHTANLRCASLPTRRLFAPLPPSNAMCNKTFRAWNGVRWFVGMRWAWKTRGNLEVSRCFQHMSSLTISLFHAAWDIEIHYSLWNQRFVKVVFLWEMCGNTGRERQRSHRLDTY